jgi:hypothetical protein
VEGFPRVASLLPRIRLLLGKIVVLSLLLPQKFEFSYSRATPPRASTAMARIEEASSEGTRRLLHSPAERDSRAVRARPDNARPHSSVPFQRRRRRCPNEATQSRDDARGHFERIVQRHPPESRGDEDRAAER